MIRKSVLLLLMLVAMLGAGSAFAGDDDEVTPQKPPKRRVVFDIDETISWLFPLSRIKSMTQEHPECNVTSIVLDNSGIQSYVFTPYIHHVFDFLLEKEVEVSFFSLGSKERNKKLMEASLKTYYGADAYEKHIAAGQFRVFSRGDVRDGKKDSRVIIGDSEELTDNTIFVEDNPRNIPKDQHPCLHAGYFDGRSLENFFYAPSITHMEAFAPNLAYYFLGVLDACFTELESNPRLTLRQALLSVVFLSGYRGAGYNFLGLSSCFIMNGFQIVKKKVSNASVYRDRSLSLL